MTGDIIAFPLNDRMNSIWMARASGRFVDKYEIDPNSQEYHALMDTIQVCLDEEGAAEWTKEEVDELVDSFFREIIIDIFTPDNDQ